MPDRTIRAIWFALFTTLGLIVGAFILGYGAAMVAAPPAGETPVAAPLPTLAAGPGSGTDLAMNQPTGRAGGGSGTDQEAPASPTRDASTAPAQPAPLQELLPMEQWGNSGLSVSLDDFDVNTALGGVEVVLQLHNSSTRSVSFSFTPAADLAVVDGQGRHYDLRWAEFEGAVKVPPRGSVQLARAFFAGPLDAGTQYLRVTVRHWPQLSENSWQVPIR